jgi:hypothetical protein
MRRLFRETFRLLQGKVRPKMSDFTWHHSFKQIYDKALAQYKRRNRNADTFFTPEETSFLASIGCTPIEVYDFAEDHSAIDWETALLITSIRRSYFLFANEPPRANHSLRADQFPAKEAEVDGIPWLPRLIMKANARLRGQLPAELMYCCGGDRAFFRKHHIHPADFLRLAWEAGEDHRKLVDFVKSRAHVA